MAKKKSWFSLVKRLFVSDAQEKKEKRKRWVFGGFKVKKLPSLTAPPQPLQKRLSEAEEEQNKHALTVAIATAAAAEAAVASAQAAAEVVKLTATPNSIHQVDQESSTHEQNWKIQQSAATQIQTAFRGYLARKALRALKGIVKLQALIRGRAVRRQAVTTLKCLQSIVNIQTQACARRFQTVEEGTDENKEWQGLGDKIIKMDSSSERRWNHSILSKQNADALILSKKEAAMKRERIRDYSFHHRKSAESERKKVNGRLRYWLEQWVDTQVSKSKELEDLDTAFNSTRTAEEFGARKQLKLRNFPRKNTVEGLDHTPVLGSRRSYHHKRQGSTGEDVSFSSSPVVVPTYMAATQSARAKARSLSSPKQRPGIYDTCSECYSPYKNKLCLVSSVVSEMPSSGRTSRPGGGGGYYQQRSPSLKAVPAPFRSSTRTAKDLSFDSECSLSNWDRQYR